MYIYEDIAFRAIERGDLEVLRKMHNDQSTFMMLHNIELVDYNAQVTWWENLHNRLY